MLQALNIAKIKEIAKKRYAYDEERIVGILLARYTNDRIADLVANYYPYWDKNTWEYFDVFWAGYGEYLSKYEEGEGKIILKFRDNKKNVYFDEKAFVRVKNKINQIYPRKKYKDGVELILVNYRQGQLYFEESMRIILDHFSDYGFDSIGDCFECITEECKRFSTVQEIKIALNKKKIWTTVKKINIFDIVSLVFSPKVEKV